MREFFLVGRGIAYRASDVRSERTTLVFVHGLSGSLSAWYPFEALFEKDYNVVTFDLRGHGLSVRPPRAGYAMEEFVEDMRALLQELSVERCVLVSHSFGTLIAMEYSKAHPKIVARNIFIAPAYDVRQFSITTFLVQLCAALAVFPLRLLPYGRTDYAQFRPTSDYSLARISLDILHMGIRSYLLSMRTIFSRNWNEHWKALSMPCLILHGSNDTIVPYTHSEALKRALPDAELFAIKGNHILVLNNIDEVTERIKKFIA
jgi:pimeloyl-ACP methyl ester carboxylesterase